jgi:CBS domain-containing protein
MSVSQTPADAGPLEGVTVGGVMRTPTTTVDPDSHVAAAAYLMKRSRDSALVVTTGDGLRPIAVITDGDVSQAVADGLDLNDTRINQLRLSRPVPVTTGTPITEAAERMLELSVEHLPVVDDGRLVGMVDMVAICRAFLQQGRTA